MAQYVCANPILPAYNVVDIDVVRKVKLIRQETQFDRLNFPVPPMKTRWGSISRSISGSDVVR